MVGEGGFVSFCLPIPLQCFLPLYPPRQAADSVASFHSIPFHVYVLISFLYSAISRGTATEDFLADNADCRVYAVTVY